MSNKFNFPININEICEILDIENEHNYDFNIEQIADPNIGAPNSICAYVKGDLPNKNHTCVLIVKENLPDYKCIIAENPQAKLNDLILEIKNNSGFADIFKEDNDGNYSVGINSVIEDNVKIGSNCIIGHNVVIHSGTKIGDNCRIGSGSVIGGDGFSFITANDRSDKIRQESLGHVIIHNNVHVGSNCSIDRGIINDTIIYYGVKIDNLVHIAHDCILNENASITAGVSLCGYVNIGKNTRLAPNSTIKQRVKIGDNNVIGLGAVILKSTLDNDIQIGNPAKSLKFRKRIL